MARRGCTCAVCEATNPLAVCAACVNLRLAEKYKFLRRLALDRDNLRKRLESQLKAKRDADIYRHWRIEHAERRTKLLECLHKNEKQLIQNKMKLEKKKQEYEIRRRSLDAAYTQLHRREKDALERFYPDLTREQTRKLEAILAEVSFRRRHAFWHLTKVFPIVYSPGGSEKPKERPSLRICGAYLPIGDNPQSVSVDDYSASLGYMARLVCQAASYLAAPLLHCAAPAGSMSRIWIRKSYWDSQACDAYPLFIARKGNEGSSSMKSDTSFGFLKMEKPKVFSRNKTSKDATQEEYERTKIGLRILKRSIWCICVYAYNMLGKPIPPDLSTFETFMDLLSILASKEHKIRSRPVLMTSSSRPDGSMLQHSFSSHIQDPEGLRKSRMEMSEFYVLGPDLYKSSMGTDEWDVIDHPVLPPPSQVEDIEQWTRAMITDATK